MRGDGIVQTLSARMGTGGNNAPLVLCIAGNTIDRTEKGGGHGLGVRENLSFALTTADRHAVLYPENTRFILRRLTPTECAALQGFPKGWCGNAATTDRKGGSIGLETPEPTEADIAFWTEVFETHRRIIGKVKKPKTRAQIVKWLRAPYSESAEYKMWGNSLAVPCAMFVLEGIAELVREESATE